MVIKQLHFKIRQRPVSRFYDYKRHRFTKTMFRVTCAINYGWHERYYSYKGSRFFRDERYAKRFLPRLGRMTEERFKAYRKYSVQELVDSGDMITIGKSIQLEPYDERRLGKTEFKDEFIGEGKRRK